jgi:hypothetical protein
MSRSNSILFLASLSLALHLRISERVTFLRIRFIFTELVGLVEILRNVKDDEKPEDAAHVEPGVDERCHETDGFTKALNILVRVKEQKSTQKLGDLPVNRRRREEKRQREGVTASGVQAARNNSHLR